MSGNARRKAILESVEACVLRDRQNAYGDCEENFADIAARWTLWLRRRGVLPPAAEITPADVAAMMVDMKLARLSANITHQDGWIDAAGYAVCGGGITRAEPFE